MRKPFILISFLFIGIISGKSQGTYSDIADRTVFRLSVLQKNIAPLYRKATKEELKTVEPSPELFKKFAEFLRQPATGLTKLINDAGCAENTKIVVATNDCLKYTMPGAGNSYSFRVKSYRIPRLADLIFTNNSFQASGIFLHGIIVNIGDVPLEKVGLETAGMKFLTDFRPEPDYEKGKIIDQNLVRGIQQNNFLYRRGLYAVENTTFVLRSIAYAGKYFRSVNGITYDEFDFDKRKDVIVAFRIVEKDREGNVTILWKELQRKDSPVLKKIDVSIKEGNSIFESQM